MAVAYLEAYIERLYSLTLTLTLLGGLDAGTVFEVSERVVNRAEGTAFIRMAKGGGWVFERIDGKTVSQPVQIEEGRWLYSVLSPIAIRKEATLTPTLTP